MERIIKGNGGIANFVEGAQPYIAMISLQFGYAGMNIVAKVALNRGMSHYVLVTYRQAFATIALAPFAFFLERKVRPKITFLVFMQIFLLGLLGPVIDQNFYYAGLKLTSPTFSCAMSNILPAMTFILALLCRMEKLEMKKVKCQAKVVGTMVTIGGAILMTLYKGNVISFFWSHHNNYNYNYNIHYSFQTNDQDWVKGSILQLFANLAWALFFVLQAMTLKKYTAHLTLTTLVCLLGTLQSMALTFVMENNKASVWNIGWDINLLAAVYAGIVSSSIAYYVQGMIMQKRGPVFVTAFTPMIMIIVAIMASFMLVDNIYFGRVVGGILMVVGLYSVLWGKYRDYKEKEAIIEEEGTINVEPMKLIILCEEDKVEKKKKLATVIEEEEEESETTTTSSNDIEMQRNDTTLNVVGNNNNNNDDDVTELPCPPPPPPIIVVIAVDEAPQKV